MDYSKVSDLSSPSATNMLSYSSRCNRRVLPAAALSRIFFPTKKELTDFFGSSSLPKGGVIYNFVIYILHACAYQSMAVHFPNLMN